MLWSITQMTDTQEGMRFNTFRQSKCKTLSAKHNLVCHAVKRTGIQSPGLDMHYIHDSKTTYLYLAAAKICRVDCCCEACRASLAGMCVLSVTLCIRQATPQKGCIRPRFCRTGGDKHPESPATEMVVGRLCHGHCDGRLQD